MSTPDSSQEQSLISGQSWMTLFYDLIVATAISRSMDIYSEEPTWQRVGFFALVLLIIFQLWTITSVELAMRETETWRRRGYLFVQLIAILLASLAMQRGGGIDDRWGFGGLAVAFLMISLLASDRGQSTDSDTSYSKQIFISMLLVAAVFAIGAVFPMGAEINGVLVAWITFPAAIFFSLILGGIWAPRLVVAPAKIPMSVIGERFIVLLLIIVGESLNKLVAFNGDERELARPWFLVMTIFILVAIWIQYFPWIETTSSPKSRLSGVTFFFSHYLLIFYLAMSSIAFGSVSGGIVYETKSGVFEDQSWSAFPLAGITASFMLLAFMQSRARKSIVTTYAVASVLLVVVSVAQPVIDSLAEEADLIIGFFILIASVLISLRLSSWAKPKKIAMA